MESQSNIEQEITQLEQQLAEKRAALGLEGEQGVALTPESLADKESLREIVGERIQQHLPAQAGAPQAPQPAPTKPQQDLLAQAGDAALSYVLPELKDKVQELVNIVFNKGLEDGIKEASKTNNPALIDAFHDVLVDELYNALVERKKLEPIK